MLQKKDFKINKKILRRGIAGGVCVIVLAEAGFAVYSKGADQSEAGQTVQSAKAEKGNISTTVVGTGTLENAAATDVVVPTGIKVKEVLVSSGDSVTEGQTLATLDEASIASELLEVKDNIETVEEQMDALSDDADEEGTTEYLEAKVLNGQLAELTEAESALESLLATQTITATCTGTISSVNVQADTEVTKSSDTDNGTTTSDVIQTAALQTSALTYLSMDDSENYSLDFLSDNSSAQQNSITISTCNVEVEAPVTGGTPQTEIAETDQYTGTISWNLSADKFQPGTAYTADIRLTAKEGYQFSSSILPEVKGADVTSQVVESDAGESILQIKAKFSKTSATSSGEETSGSAAGTGSTGTAAQAGNSGNGQESGSPDSESGSGSTAAGASGGSGSGSTSGANTASSGTDSSGTGASGTSDYSLYETAAFSIASDSQAAVSINVDELDILSVQEGQTATITLDALEGQEFEGTITGISKEASSGNSSAKYPVTITFDKTEDMLQGMSASATIHVDEADDAVLIPVDALMEKGDSTFVYTSKDSDGNLSGEVEVETGISNGSQVEITSGLEEGDTVYYLKEESSGDSKGQNMPGSMDGQSGNMPDMKNNDSSFGGGQAPGGGGPSGSDSSSGGK